MTERDTERGFGTGLRSALARARAQRRQAEEEAAAAEAVNPELPLIAPELRRGEPEAAAPHEAEPSR
jgi:hypothetical protein